MPYQGISVFYHTQKLQFHRVQVICTQSNFSFQFHVRGLSLSIRSNEKGNSWTVTVKITDFYHLARRSFLPTYELQPRPGRFLMQVAFTLPSEMLLGFSSRERNVIEICHVSKGNVASVFTSPVRLHHVNYAELVRNEFIGRNQPDVQRVVLIIDGLREEKH